MTNIQYFKIFIPVFLRSSMRVNLEPVLPLIVAFQTFIHCHQLPVNLLISSNELRILCNLCQPKGRTVLVNSLFSNWQTTIKIIWHNKFNTTVSLYKKWIFLYKQLGTNIIKEKICIPPII